MTDVQPRWNFPRASGGRSHGFKEAGLSTFSGDIMPSLVREICQNSLDAAADPAAAVRVEFERYDVSAKEIPGLRDISRMVGRAVPYWNGKQNKEVKDHLQRVSHHLKESSQISVLRAADFRTTGLRGAYEDKVDHWNLLTKLDGGATKGGVSAGSYGIGKNAPFAASELRMVFYRTQTDEAPHGGRAAQGIVYLPAFPEDVKRELSTQTLGVGYYGDPGVGSVLANQPVETIPLLDKLCPRSEIGTDVFVFGFQEHKNWIDVVAAEILESFILAIHKGTLEVFLREGSRTVEISADTLPQLTEVYAKKARNAASYFEILAKPEAVETFERDFHGKGSLRLRLLANTAQPLNRKVLVVRAGNMKILAIDRMRGHLNFTGILELVGGPLNEFFRALENPQHNQWDADRYIEEPSLARKHIQELRSWVRETVAKAAAVTTSDQVFVKGLAPGLQSPDQTGSDAKTGQPEDALPQAEASVQIEESPPPGQNDLVARSGAQTAEDGAQAVLTDTGQMPLPRENTVRKTKKLGGSGGGSARKKPGRAGGPQPQAVKLSYVRLVRTQDGNARLIIEAPWTVRRGSLLLRIVGDNGRPYRQVHVREARCASKETTVYAHNGRIHFENLPIHKRTAIDLAISEKMSYATEAILYEDR